MKTGLTPPHPDKVDHVRAFGPRAIPEGRSASSLNPLIPGPGAAGLFFDNRVLERIYEGEAGPFGLVPEVL
jgi:hypothetical protein